MVVWVKVMPRSAIKGAELEGEIPSYAEHDDFLVKVPTLEELLCRGEFRHRWPLTPQSQLFKFAPEPLGDVLTTYVPVGDGGRGFGRSPDAGFAGSISRGRAIESPWRSR